jgi:Predicted exonuclease of the beta-lactamase fold involved in RNA processing
VELTPEFSVRLADAGHILGSSMVQLTIRENGRSTTVLFSGDIGRYDQPILRDPAPPPAACDYLVCESTYGDRDHPTASPYDALAEVIQRVSRRGGAVVIPAFAVGRTQLLMHVLRELEDWDRIPQLPVFLDSPMATSVTSIYMQHREEHDLNFRREHAAGTDPLNCHKVKMTRSVDESKAINRVSEPCIILSASGMATGGRVLHHLARRLPDSRNAVLLPGFQAQGTRGRALAEGARTLRIHGEDVPVVAEVVVLNQFFGPRRPRRNPALAGNIPRAAPRNIPGARRARRRPRSARPHRRRAALAGHRSRIPADLRFVITGLQAGILRRRCPGLLT